MNLKALIKKGKYYAKMAAQSYARVNGPKQHRFNNSHQSNNPKDYKYHYNAKVQCNVHGTEFNFNFYCNEQNKPFGFVCDSCGENSMFLTPNSGQLNATLLIGSQHTVCFRKLS